MGIYAMTFDHSGSRLITCEADKTIKIYKEDETAVNTIEIFLFYWNDYLFFFRLNKVIQLIGHPIFSNENDINFFFLLFCCDFFFVRVYSFLKIKKRKNK